ncbi:MAG: toll/interleukin-1 receptor domain-containing protein [Gemmatimonadetes bacterium]|nr:toll/interleukin-1 receptor domain-containing protein [Gemmatimonadota bacterium]
MAHDVFISYSTRDQATALAVVNGLESAGIRCWIAPRDIKAGDVWAQAIVSAIAASRAMVLVFSSHANRSSHVVNEVDAAIRKGAIVVPFRIEDVMPEGAMEYHLRTRHWLDALTSDQSRHIGELVATMKGLLGQPAGPRAPETEFGPLPPKSAPAPSPSKGRPVIQSTASGFHVKLPKPSRLSPRAAKLIAGVAVAAVALIAATRYFGGTRPLEGVAFDVREATAGSEFRTTVTAKSMRFFESARGIPAFGNRVYGSRFAAAQTRYVNTEVVLELEAPGRTLQIPVGCTIFNRAGGVTGTFTLENRISANSTSWQNASGWGADRPGSWKPGPYRVECRYGDRLIARNRFEILD